MVGLTTGLQLFGGLVLLLANGFFVVTEFAMTRVRQFPEEEFQGHRGLERAWEMTERLEIYLSGCQVGITIASVGLGVVAEPALAAVVDAALESLGLANAVGLGSSQSGHATLSIILALALINLLHVIVGEQAPTYLGVERTKLVAKYCAPVLYAWTKLMSPVIRFADWTAKRLLGLFGVTIERSWTEAEEGEDISRSELRTQMGRILSQGQDISAERRDEVINALEIGERTVDEILTPRDDVVLLSAESSTDETLSKIRENPQHVRFPLVGDDFEDLRGFIYTPTVLCNLEALESGEITFVELAAPPMRVSADLRISEVIDEFQDQNQELAFVVDDEERVVGLVTASDAFEAITGDLEDPLDLGPAP